MPVTIVRSEDNHTLWQSCTSAFLDEIGSARGPGSFPSFLWLRNRAQRDLLLDAAEARGALGWFAPPFGYLGELATARFFDLPGRTVGLLTRRRLVARLAQLHAKAHGIAGPDHGSGVVRGHMLDRLLGELLPAGVDPDAFAAALDAVALDDFARRRNAWVVAVYREYRAALAERGLYDFRETNALIARRVDDGALPQAIGGARQLHVYGLHTPRDRVRLLRALHAQAAVDVRVYVPWERAEPGEWDALALPTETLRASTRRERIVQPAPNPRREFGWMAQQVKEALLDEKIQPHDIAVVARTGREDVRRAYEALQEVGVRATARIRTPLAEVPILRALLQLFEAAAHGWDYRALRSVLASPYFDLDVDFRWLDFLAARRRPTTLAGWLDELEALTERVRAKEALPPADEDQADRDLRDLSVRAPKLAEDQAVLRAMIDGLTPLHGARSERAWVEAALELATHGLFGMRRNLSFAPLPESKHTPEEARRWDIVRLDQRGLRQLEDLLREWSKLDLDDAELDPREWHTLLQRLLQSHEIALSTPLQKGVQVLEAHDAALTPYRRVYILHANDGVFPAAPMGGGVITDAERVRLRETGLELDDHERELRRERTLWRAVAAVPHIEASFRTTDTGGTPLLPSLMIFELAESVAHENELPRSFDPLGDPLSPSQALHAAALELSSALVRDAEDGRVDGRIGSQLIRVRAVDPHVIRHAVLAAYAEQERGTRGTKYADDAPPPNPWNGQLTSPAVLEHVAQRFGENRVWSASMLELYSRSPFLFFLDRVLHLRELEEADEETTALTIGSIAHEVLQLFYASYIGGPRPRALEGETLMRLRNMIERVVNERLARGEWLGSPVLWQVRREALNRQLEEFVAWELSSGFLGDESPLLCEYELERDGVPVALEHFDMQNTPRRMLLRGRVDRIDRLVNLGAETWRVVDYKSNFIPGPIDFRRGLALQGPLYMKALSVREGKEVDLCRYRSLKQCEDRSIDWNSDEFSSALRIAFSIPARVRAGLFEPALPPAQTWKDWDPGVEIRRTSAILAEGTRFNG
ncbi:MAG TPA: PD-(D/E)XK nuclease family protein [Longimicrobiales bacterium]